MYAGAQAPVHPGSVEGAPANAPYGQPNPQPGIFTPAGAQVGGVAPGAGPVDALAHQFGNVGLNPTYSGGAGVSGVATTPSYGGSTDPYQPHDSSAYAPKLPLNQLYNMDLVQSLPPHIEDLSYPPPPIVVPPELSATRHPEANAPSNYIRCTLNVVPNSSSLLKKSKLPLALVIRPCVSLTDAGAPIPTVGDAVICRCRRCRSYINPFVEFVDHGNRWRCNMCGLTNEVPAQFDWDGVRSERVNRADRCELNYGVTEFIAPPEYMVRPPQPPVYVFILDCSVTAVQNGLLATAARIIQENLDRLPNYDGRTRVAFIAVDSALHFFHLPLPSAVQVEPSMLVVSDLEDPFLPVPSGLLVNLAECRAPIDILLNSIGTMFTKTTDNGCALGSAIKAAPKLIGSLGGKIICLSASLPNLGHAKLDAREDRKVLGTSKESSLLQTANSFYKSFAVECNRAQVTVDMFLFGSSYQDVASLSNLPRYTAGQTYFYPGWSASRAEDTIKLAHELGEHMSMEMAMEAVLRVRASNGLRMNAFYGNFFNRSSDLCSFPTFPRDQSYVVEVAFEEMITKPYVAFQAGILHTTCHGDRRIRVITLTLPVSSVLQDIYASADQLAITAYFTHKAVEKALSSGLQEARDLLTNRLADLLSTYKKELMTTNVGASAPLQFCTNLRMLPLLVNALVKHVGLRKSAQIPSDLRSAALCLLSTLPLPYLIKYIHPDFYRLDDMPLQAGLPDPETGQLVMPPKLNLSGEQIVSSGLYLIDDGQTMFLWIGHDAVPQLVEDVFGVDSLSIVRSGKGEIPELELPPDVSTDPQENPRALFNARVRSIVSCCREKNDSITWQSLYIIKGDGDPSLRLWASTFFIEDRTDQSVSYYQFLVGLRDKLNS